MISLLKKNLDKTQACIFPCMLLLIVLSHINFNYFTKYFINSQFLISYSIILLCFFQFYLYIYIKKHESLEINLIDFITFFFYIYIAANNFLLSTNVFNDEFINFSAVFCIYFITRQNTVGDNLVINYLKITALSIIIIESLYCILQWKNIIPNLNPSYYIGGSYGHSGFTAVSISILVPYILCYNKNFRTNKIAKVTIPFLLIFLLLIILDSRAAILSCILSFFAIVVIPKISFSKRLKAAVSIIITALTISFISFIKSDSSLGRIFIWQKCLAVMQENLFFGVGLGKFAFEYNNFQSNFFSKTGHGNKAAYLADYTESAFNEFLQTGVEFGLIGLFFIIVLILVFLYNTKKSPSHPFFYSILFSFVPLFFGWSVLRYFPIGSFFFIGLSLLSKQSENYLFVIKYLPIKRLISFSVVLSFMIILNFTVNRSEYIISYFNVQNEKELDYPYRLKKEFPKLQYSDNFIYKYCDYLIKTNDLKQASLVAEKSAKWLNSPALYHLLYRIHMEKKDYEKAIKDLDYLINISPSKIYPKYALAKLYYASGNKSKADLLTKEILKIKPKILNADVLLMKEELKMYLKENN